jgi:ABC-type transport system involved in Fe-S cluster assembly fused permease/ATPase subunit
MEKMLDLFKEDIEVVDKPEAEDIQVRLGHIKFGNLSRAFSPR